MTWAGVCKVFQKQSFDLLSRKNGILVILTIIFIFFFLTLQFGEVLISILLNNHSSYRTFSDNIGGKIYSEETLPLLPIDIVYTWVNGSDPRLLRDLAYYKMIFLKKESSESNDKFTCLFNDCIKSNFFAIIPSFAETMSLEIMREMYTSLRDAVNYFDVICPLTNIMTSIIEFNNSDAFNSSINTEIFINGKAATIYPVYYSSDSDIKGKVLAEDTVIVIGLPNSISHEALISKLREYSISIILIDLNIGQAVLKSVNKSITNQIISKKIIFSVNLKDGNLNVAREMPNEETDKFNKETQDIYGQHMQNIENSNAKDTNKHLNNPKDQIALLFGVKKSKPEDNQLRKLVFKKAYYIWHIEQNFDSENLASSRFQDHDELKYSLRLEFYFETN